jgi:hypothetical protein
MAKESALQAVPSQIYLGGECIDNGQSEMTVKFKGRIMVTLSRYVTGVTVLGWILNGSWLQKVREGSGQYRRANLKKSSLCFLSDRMIFRRLFVRLTLSSTA